MKHSSSSARLWATLALVVVVVFFSPAPWMAHLSDASAPTAEASASASAATASASASFERGAVDRPQRHHHRSHLRRDAGAYSGSLRKPASWCPHCSSRSPPYPPPPHLKDEGEVDPRYGVEKRLVPTGPNPLHN